MGFRNVNLIAVALDAIESCLLMLLLFIVSPVSFLRTFSTSKGFKFVRVLWPKGQLAAVVRAQVDYRFGLFDRVIAALESTIGSVEEVESDINRFSGDVNFVLSELYTRLAKAHLRTGHVDDAALTIVRAGRGLGIEKLNGLSDFDVKTAQIVRAGIAAGKLLEQGGLTTFMLHNSATGKGGKLRAEKSDMERTRERGVARAEQKQQGAKIIPFPRPTLH